MRCGTVLTLAGNGEEGYADGIGAAARFKEPWAIVVDAQGAIFVSNSDNNCLRKWDASNGAVSSLAGDAEEWPGFADWLGSSARFYNPSGMALDTEGHLIVADSSNNCIRKVTTAEGRVTTVAGSGSELSGFADGSALAARFDSPMSITVDGSDNILVADQDNHRIRMIAGKSGRVMTVAGSAERGKEDGTGASARFDQPLHLTQDERGRLLVLDNVTRGSVRVVEASLAPPQRLAPKVQSVVQDALRMDLQQAARGHGAGRCDVCGGWTALPGAPLRAGGAEPLLLRHVRVRQRHA